MADWWIFRGDGEPHDGVARLPAPLHSRLFDGGPPIEPQFGTARATEQHLGSPTQGQALLLSAKDIDLINAAIYWRRPLLVSGSPGTGKSTIAHAVAHELRLGSVLHWPVTSRSTVQDGLYTYDALARLEDANLLRAHGGGGGGADAADPPGGGPATPGTDIGRYIRLGPLGTALLPHERPRVLLIDEFDKGDSDLPNDLLHVFENGEFALPELLRLRQSRPRTDVGVTGGDEPVTVQDGRVRCRAFPIVVITDNAEHDYPAAFLRRCVRLRLEEPSRERLAGIVAAHLGPAVARQSDDLIDAFLDSRQDGTVATDQLLGAVYLASAARLGVEDRRELAQSILAPLDPGP
ncbi:MoxR family ATPase [Streptomyces sp. V4-01]|uniref:MoxR family ATPase n=1 Tax=Actinacidiphila polyblastidii TaxID=3110430 RepID=A0ABU7PB91_9ACTN|nr:MoxR family ATPase [Streptomyces sp. V4-01]